MEFARHSCQHLKLIGLYFGSSPVGFDKVMAIYLKILVWAYVRGCQVIISFIIFMKILLSKSEVEYFTRFTF